MAAGFIGEYECKLDDKSRFMLPSGLRKQIDPASKEQFVLNRGFEGCLVLYPQNEWDKITSRMQKLNLFQAKTRAFYRQFHNGATAIQLDGSGRILIPKGLIGYADIKKEVVLFAYADRIELWSKVRYEKVMGQDADSFAQLAEEVMGGSVDDVNASLE